MFSLFSTCWKRFLILQFFFSSILESFEEHRGSMLMIKIDNRLWKLVVDILCLFFISRNASRGNLQSQRQSSWYRSYWAKNRREWVWKPAAINVYHAATISVRDIVPYLQPRVDMHGNEFKGAKEIFPSLGTQHGRYAIKAYDKWFLSHILMCVMTWEGVLTSRKLKLACRTSWIVKLLTYFRELK